MDKLILKCLNSADLALKIAIIQLLSMLLRLKNVWRVPLVGPDITCAQAKDNSLIESGNFNSDNEGSSLIHLHDILVSLHQIKENRDQDWDEDQDQDEDLIHQIHHTLLHTYIDHHMKKAGRYFNCQSNGGMPCSDGSFKEPVHITSTIAKLEYCIYLTFLKEIGACMADNDWSEVDEAFACDEFSLSSWKKHTPPPPTCIHCNMALPHIWWSDTKTWQTMNILQRPSH
ncbi:hypothetical protein HD554DRAFT_2037101 [Boletus coccyginus]|nr:hypothetical protein HD554DRAFT_2037101 [Boletus coccyginus]